MIAHSTHPQKSTQLGIALAIQEAYGGIPSAIPDVYRRHSTLEHCDRLTMPLFIAHGESDALMPVASMREFALRMSGCGNFRYEEIPGGDHGAPLFRTELMERLYSRVPELKRQFEKQTL